MREDYLLSVKKAIGEHRIYIVSSAVNNLNFVAVCNCTLTFWSLMLLIFSLWYHFSSVDFVLKDQREKEKDVEEKRPPHREEMDVVPKPWHKDYVAGLEAMSQKLHITTPCMLQVLDFWHTKFG